MVKSLTVAFENETFGGKEAVLFDDYKISRDQPFSAASTGA